jgi:hypothetical protein
MLTNPKKALFFSIYLAHKDWAGAIWNPAHSEGKPDV